MNRRRRSVGRPNKSRPQNVVRTELEEPKHAPPPSPPGQFGHGKGVPKRRTKHEGVQALRESGGMTNPFGRRVFTAAEVRDQEDLVERMLTDGYTFRAIEKAMRDRFHIGGTRTRKLIERTQERWEEEGNRRHKGKREELIRHIERMKREAQGGPILNEQGAVIGHKAPNHAAVARYTQMLVDIYGIAEPKQLAVDVEFTSAMKAVFGTMSPEELLELAGGEDKRDG